MIGPDPFLTSLLADVPEEHRAEVAKALGTADVLGRHMPIHEISRIVSAVWLTYCVIDAWERGDHDTARVLDQVAGCAVTDVGGRMAIHAGLAGMGAQPRADDL